MRIKMPEMPDTQIYLDMSKVFQSLADYQLKRETSGRRWILTTQKSLDLINELLNLAMEHRSVLMPCGFLVPMQEITGKLIESVCQGIEAQGTENDHMIVAMEEISQVVKEVVEENEQRKRFAR